MNHVITISRQYGSKGSDIGKSIANHYNIPLYMNKDIINETRGVHAEESMIGNRGVSANNSFLYSLAMDMYSMEYNEGSIQNMPTGHKKFIVQTNKIQELANNGPCIFVGRCADYALADYENVIKVFVYADMDVRIQHIKETQNITPQEAKKNIIKIDKERSRYYNYYTTKKWGDISSYDLCINSSKLTIDKCAEIIINYIDSILI